MIDHTQHDPIGLTGLYNLNTNKQREAEIAALFSPWPYIAPDKALSSIKNY